MINQEIMMTIDAFAVYFSWSYFHESSRNNPLNILVFLALMIMVSHTGSLSEYKNNFMYIVHVLIWALMLGLYIWSVVKRMENKKNAHNHG